MRKQIACILTAVMLLTFWGCSTPSIPKEMPENFSFVLEWGTYGSINSYDSKTGKLMKAVSENNTTEYILPKDKAEYIYGLIYTMDPDRYPQIYDPQEDRLATSPPMTLVLTVRIGDTKTTIEAIDIAAVFGADNKKGQRFLTTCKEIIDILTATEEWNAFPEYEFYYD